MENTFGVTLKSTGAGKPTDRNFKPSSATLGSSTGKKTSHIGPPPKFTDLKARFNDEKTDQVSKKSVTSPGTKRREFGTDYSAKKTVASPGTKRREFGTDYSAKKTNSSSTGKGKLSQPAKLEKVGESGIHRNVTSQGSFERKTKIDENARQDLQDEDDDGGAQIAVGKVFTRQDSNTYTATVENRVQRQGLGDDPVDKVRASNLLTGQLAMLRIRPGSGGKKDERTTFSSRTVEKSNNGISKVETTTTTTRSNFNTKNKTFSTNSGSSASPKLGKKFTSSSSAPMEFGLSFSPKKIDDSKSRDLMSKTVSSHSRQSSSDSIGSSTSSPRSNPSTDLVQLDTSSLKKLDSILGGTGKVEHRGNRVETKTITKTVETGVKRPGSPRTIVTETKIVTTSVSKKPGIDKTVSSREEVTTFSTSQSESQTARSWGGKKTDVIKTSSDDTKPVWLDKSKEMVSKFQTKMKPTSIDVLVNTSDNSSDVKKSRTPFIKPADRTVKQLTTSKPTGVGKPGKTDINSNKMAPAWETRVVASSLQRRSSDLSDTGSDISSRSSSSLPSSSDILKKKPYTLRKLEPGNFKQIMGSFEEKSKSGSTTPERKKSDPKIEFKKPLSRAKNIVLERKNSFECPPSPPVSPRDATQLVLKETGPIPNVKKFAKEINSGRVRAFSTGSIRDSGSEQEYNDALSRRHGQEWPNSDFSSDEALYEFIGEPGVEDGDGKSRHSRNMARRLGQKRKGVYRPSFEEQSSSDLTTEGSSKDGTLESTDDRAVEGDAENESDSSNSGIYEPIDQNWVNKLKVEQLDLPPELPADRKKKKKKKDGNKSGAAAIGSKLKKLYNKPKKSSGELGLSKVASAPQLSLSEQSTSSGVLNKLGDKLKLITRAKSSDPKLLAEAEVVISSSEYDAEGYTEEDCDMNNMNIPLEDIVYIDSSSSIDQPESPESEHRNDYEDTAPPLPPRVVSDEDDSAPKPPPKTRSSMINTIDASLGLVPMRPPKRNSSRPQSEDEAAPTPALPPRNRVSTNVNLDTVVPVTPGMVSTAHSTGDLRNPKGQWHASKDSYLHGHVVQSSSRDLTDGPPVPHRPNSGEENIYIECDRPAATELEGIKRPLEKKLSSLYMKSADVASTPDKSPTNQKSNVPFQDIMMFQSQYQNTADDNMYLDLEDEDQLYGTLGERYTPKIHASEPLYQYYHKDMASRASKKCSVMHAQSDDEEDDERIYEALDDVIEAPVETKADRVKTSTLEMFTKKSGTAMRALWCEMPEVKESGLLETLSSQERKIQEATFEIITSEATFLRSLNVLMNTFLLSQEFSAEHSDRCVLTRHERHVIFSNIGSIRDTSERFLVGLEAKWQESVLMEDISSVIESHANAKFECYVRYCSNQTFQERQVQELMYGKKPEFSDVIRRMESSPECQGLPMMSFLLLPMQRITRLPLLVDAICHRMEPATEQHKGATRALDALNRVVRKCNDGARKMQQTEQMCRLVQNLEFKVKEIPLISASRHLLKQGELTRVLTDTSSRLPLRKGKSKQAINIFLFNDIILISKKKSNTQYVVNDYSPRNALHVETLDSTDKSRYLPQGAPSGCKNLFVVVLLENHEQKHTELILSCKSPSDRTRWIDSLSPSAKEHDSEKIYEEWDCPQVQCTTKYSATEPDELSLEESDVVNVFKKMGDGWYEGERIRDGERGWFPSDVTMEIVNSHVRARNLRLRYRLLLASQDYGDVYS